MKAPRFNLVQGLAAFGLSLLLIAPAFAQEKATALEEAFAKEFSFLEDQKRDLERRVAAFKKEAASTEKALEADVEDLRNQILALEKEADVLAERTADAERMLQSNQDSQEILDATYQQAKVTLKDYGRDLEADETFLNAQNEAQFVRLFEVANDLSAELGSVRSEQGFFYLEDGRKAEGQVIKLGQIAAYGISADGTGALAPAGAGELKLWAAPAADVANAFAQGQSPETVKIFLYESLKKSVADQKEDSVEDIINSGGIIGWVIVLLGVLGAILIVLRILFLFVASASTGSILQRVSCMLQQGQVDAALTYCEGKKGSTARVVAATLRNVDRDREHVEDIVSESILHESGTLNRFGAMIMVIAAVSPLLGLLGTVTGMIATFDVITEFGTGDPKLLSGGISTALVTTELGLIVAIPTLIMGNLLAGWANRIKDDMEKAALRSINLYQSAKASFNQAASA